MMNMLLADEIDVAFVRTGIIERMRDSGALNEAEITVVDRVEGDTFPQIRTTQLYPEWFVIANAAIDPALSDQLYSALMQIESAAPEAQTARIRGFMAPLEVGGVVSAMQAVRIPPYN